MGWFLLRRFVDPVRVYFLLIFSRNHSNTFLLHDLQRNYFMSILMMCKETGGESFNDTFFKENLPTTASEIHTASFLRIFLISLDKSVLLHCRCLMSKFTEMLVLVHQNIFSAFQPILYESFSNSYGFALLQEFNPFYPHLVLYDRKRFCSILTDLNNLKFPLLN